MLHELGIVAEVLLRALGLAELAKAVVGSEVGKQLIVRVEGNVAKLTEGVGLDSILKVSTLEVLNQILRGECLALVAEGHCARTACFADAAVVTITQVLLQLHQVIESGGRLTDSPIALVRSAIAVSTISIIISLIVVLANVLLLADDAVVRGQLLEILHRLSVSIVEIEGGIKDQPVQAVFFVHCYGRVFGIHVHSSLRFAHELGVDW